MAKVPLYTPRVPSKTEAAIEASLESDGGDRFRALLQKHLPLIQDAYRQGESTFRSHFGMSSIGRPCARELWLKWRWFGTKKIPARLVRLFNRGHREEACFLALLEMIGVHIHGSVEGEQDRVSCFGGHGGSALDGTLYGVPDAPTEWVLGEFKTHNTKSFCKLVAEGIRTSKPDHYAQIQACMKLRCIFACLYMAINKNDDDIYCELVRYDPDEAEKRIDRAGRLIFAREVPPRISNDPSDMGCRMCDMVDMCQHSGAMLKNCRTCRHSVADPGGTWGCELLNVVLDKGMQIKGCDQHDFIHGVQER